MDRKWWVLIGTGLAGLCFGIDYTIVNTALAPIHRELHASVTQLQWLISGFGVFFVGFLVAFGRLGDLLGRRKIFYLGIIGFSISSLGAGLSPSPQYLIAMRLLQGLFGATIYPTGMALVAQAFAENERARALGIYGSFLGIGFVLGPVIGSLVLTISSWRWIFFINLPILLTCAIICLPVIKESKLVESVKIDWLGTITLILCLGLLVFSISEGPTYGWNSIFIISTFIISIVLLIAFIMIEKHAPAPLIPLQLFMNSGFLSGLIVFMIIAIEWTIVFLMPLYLHISVQLSSAWVGIVLLSMTIMTMVAPPIAGHWYDKRGPKAVSYTLFLCTIISLILFMLLKPHGPIWLIIISFILFGTGWGGSNGISVPLGLSKLPNIKDSGLIAGSMLTLMNVFGIMILAFDVTLFNHFYKTRSFVDSLHIACGARHCQV
ncbi:MAG: MFS transporter [Gammaproteobacteria bacterium]|nr:MFS transporter [Gammaproteobacteria bacterium]